MAISFKTKHGPLARLKAILHWPRFNHVPAAGRPQAWVTTEMGSESAEHIGEVDGSKWKRYDSRRFGITRSMIPPHAYNVLTTLRRRGFDAYLVGGCVRDLLLKRIPKDFDVITNTNLRKVKRQFCRAQIVGKRFPICMVQSKSSVVEVSSFKTAVRNAGVAPELPPIPRGCSEKDFIRWKDSMRRDFTVNSLFLDPFMHTIHDYANGMGDLKSLTLRTLVPAESSFREDCARILRGLRIAARLGLGFSEETGEAIRSLSPTITSLPQERIMMEINYMLSYGAAEPSLRLLWRFGLLDILLPLQAAYLGQLDGGPPSHSNSMLMKLFSNMDKSVSCDRPSDSILWVGLLAFHLALIRCPQDALVIRAFASILHFGRKKGVEFAKTEANHGVHFVPEISESSKYEVAELEERVSDLASIVNESVIALNDSKTLNKSMSRYPLLSCSGLVFVSKRAAKEAQRIFQVLIEHSDEEAQPHESNESRTNHKSLGFSLRMTRSLLGKIILETLSGRVPLGVGIREVERREPGKTMVDKCWEGPGHSDSITAEEHRRPGKRPRRGATDLAMRKGVPVEPGDISREKPTFDLSQRNEIVHKLRAIFHEENCGSEKQSR